MTGYSNLTEERVLSSNRRLLIPKPMLAAIGAGEDKYIHAFPRQRCKIPYLMFISEGELERILKSAPANPFLGWPRPWKSLIHKIQTYQRESDGRITLDNRQVKKSGLKTGKKAVLYKPNEIKQIEVWEKQNFLKAYTTSRAG